MLGKLSAAKNMCLLLDSEAVSKDPAFGIVELRT
jgi:hypothetical protein